MIDKPEYTIGEYSGMAVRMGAGIEAWEVSIFMVDHDIAVVAAGCNTVDLFWTMRGGGGRIYAIIISAVMKAYPPVNITSSSISLSVSSNPGPGSITDFETFWKGVSTYYRYCASILDAGGYGFSYIRPQGNNSYTFTSSASFPGLAFAEVINLLQPLYTNLKSLGINITTPTSLSTRPYASHRTGTGDRPNNTRYRSRLLPRENWESDTLWDQTMAAIRTAMEAGAENDFYFHGTLTSPTEEVAGWPGRDSAVNPAWRNNRMHAMLMDSQPAGLTGRQARDRDELMQGFMGLLREASPGAGAYMNEGDPGEPGWQGVFFGGNYGRLLKIKGRYDPEGVFWATTTMGSEGWEVRAVDGYPNSQNGRLCRVGG